MNSHLLPPRRRARPPADPIGYAARRLSSLLAFAGAIVGVAVVSLLEGVGVPILVAMAIGLAALMGAGLLSVMRARLPFGSEG